MTALLALALLAQPPADPPAEKDAPKPAKADKKAGPPQFELQFANGSTLKQVVVLTDEVRVTTKYGRLTIPAADLRRVEFGKGEKGTDTVEAAEFTARGKLDTAELQVRTAEFGEATVKVAALKGLRFTPAGGRSAELTVEAARYARPNWAEWLDTGVDVAAGETLEITASGTLDLSPHSPGSQTTGPGGTNPPAPPMPDNARPPAEPSGRPRPWWLTGQLVARIGKDGRPFPTGTSYKVPAAAAGRVYLIVAPNGFSTDMTGSYKVTVKAGG